MWFEVDFGPGQAGVATVGYRLYLNDGTDDVARTTTGVVEIAQGGYGVDIAIIASTSVGIEWDTGGGSPIYARESIDHSLIADYVWDENIKKSNHNVTQSAAKFLRQSADLVQIDGVVSDVTPGVGGFDTNLTHVDDYFDDSVLIFSNGAANAGIGITVSTYVNANGRMTFDTPDQWPVTPVNGDDFVIYATHIHPLSQIADGVWAKVLEAEGNITAQQILSILIAEAAGELDAASSTFKTPDGAATRISGTADSNGNRSGITITPSS